MPIDVEICLVAMHALADVIGHPAHSENIAGAVEGEGVCRVQSLTGQHLGVNRLQAGVVRLKSVRSCHPFDDIAGAYVKSQGLRDARFASLVQFRFR